MTGGTRPLFRVAGATLLACVVACGSSRDGRAQNSSDLRGFLNSDSDRRIVDQDGRPVSQDQMDGKVVALTFFSTDCSILCVERLLDVAAVVKGLPAAERSRVRILALAVDPARDTPDALKSFSGGVQLDTAAVTLASGPPEAVAGMLASIGWRPGGEGPDRAPSTVFVFDRRGAFAMRYGATPLDRHRFGQDLAVLADLDHGVGQNVARASDLH